MFLCEARFFLIVFIFLLSACGFDRYEYRFSGYIWPDDNGNGLQDGVEAGIQGATVRITNNENPEESYVALSGPDGRYSFRFESEEPETNNSLLLLNQ